LHAEPVSPVDDAINSWFDPIATWFGNIIFFPITIGGASFPFVVVWRIFAALVFTIYFGFIQARAPKPSSEIIRAKFPTKDDPGEATHFQTLASALSGTVGLGIIAGVAIDIAVGGPNATVGMIDAAPQAMRTEFVICNLGAKYR